MGTKYQTLNQKVFVVFESILTMSLFWDIPIFMKRNLRENKRRWWSIMDIFGGLLTYTWAQALHFAFLLHLKVSIFQLGLSAHDRVNCVILLCHKLPRFSLFWHLFMKETIKSYDKLTFRRRICYALSVELVVQRLNTIYLTALALKALRSSLRECSSKLG